MHLFFLRLPRSRRFAVIVNALLFATLCPMASKSRSTNATGLDFTAKEDHGDLRTSHFFSLADHMESPPLAQVEKDHNYEPNFAGFDRSIIGRVPGNDQGLDNNVPMKINIQQGKTQYYTFHKDQPSKPTSAPPRKLLPFESAPRAASDIPEEDTPQNLLKRQDDSQQSKKLYVSIAICDQPLLKDQSLSGEAQPLLTVYISKSSDNPQPGLGRSDLSFNTSQGGYGFETIEASGDIFLGVTAAANANFDGDYNYELTVSIDALYTAYNPSNRSLNEIEDYFSLLDSDSKSALFLSSNFTTDTDRPPYSIFVYSASDSAVSSIQQSLCGLRNHVQIKGNLLDGPSANVNTTSAEEGNGIKKQQFYVTGLNASTEYFAILAVDVGGNVVGGGGTVGMNIPFRTKSDQNCAIIYDLPFCKDVAYAVPFNPTNSNLSNLTNLAALYDNNAQSLYKNFSHALQQIPCNTTDEAKYSLARNCTDCENAYKSWLCAVTIPRCEDFSASDRWLQARAVSQELHDGRPPLDASDPALSPENKTIRYMNSSRNQLIDDLIHPGPWKEILPCDEICYNLMQSCPASMNFLCPLKDDIGKSYGVYTKTSTTCNYPGKPGDFSNAAYTMVDKMLISASLGLVLLVQFAS